MEPSLSPRTKWRLSSSNLRLLLTYGYHRSALGQFRRLDLSDTSYIFNTNTDNIIATIRPSLTQEPRPRQEKRSLVRYRPRSHYAPIIDNWGKRVDFVTIPSTNVGLRQRRIVREMSNGPMREIGRNELILEIARSSHGERNVQAWDGILHNPLGPTATDEVPQTDGGWVSMTSSTNSTDSAYRLPTIYNSPNEVFRTDRMPTTDSRAPQIVNVERLSFNSTHFYRCHLDNGNNFNITQEEVDSVTRGNTPNDHQLLRLLQDIVTSYYSNPDRSLEPNTTSTRTTQAGTFLNEARLNEMLNASPWVMPALPEELPNDPAPDDEPTVRLDDIQF